MPVMSHSWNASRADEVRAHLARDADQRRRVHPGVGDGGHEVRRARPGCGHRDANASGSTGVALGHVPRPLLVPSEDVAHSRPAGERVVQRQNRAAGEPERDVDSLGFERAQDRIGAVGCHATASR